MEIERLVWDPQTRQKIAKKHQLSRPEGEEVFARDYHIRRFGKLYHAYGQSAAGRYLFVIFLPLGRGRAQVVTARDMTQQERTHPLHLRPLL